MVSLTDGGRRADRRLVQAGGHVITEETLKPLNPAERRTCCGCEAGLRKLT
jgi:hypothetical protein